MTPNIPDFSIGSDKTYRGRFAPSPTGALHFGSLLAALGSWLRARSQGGAWLVRMEDIDPPREQPGASQRILDTLAAFGLVSDEPVVFQSTRSEAYAAALSELIERGLAFRCRCSRKHLQQHGVHRGRCHSHANGKAAWRLLVPVGEVSFDDLVQGRQMQDVRAVVGDFVLRRADGLWAYQLAVVVDDHAQGITEIVRGADLLDSTPRQIVLQQALRLPTPGYAHLPALHGIDGHKLSKQTHATAIDGADPMPALRHALTILGIGRERQPAGGSVDGLLNSAMASFDLTSIPRVRVLCSATWQVMTNG